MNLGWGPQTGPSRGADADVLRTVVALSPYAMGRKKKKTSSRKSSTNARKKATSRRGDREHAHDHRTLRALIWAIAAGLWLMIAAALISHDPADPPGHAVAPQHPDAKNWVGRFGAVVSHELYLVLGPGVWIAMAASLAALIVRAAGRRISHWPIRALGAALASVAASCMLGLWLASLFEGPEGAAGLLAGFINHHLLLRFNTLGASFILVVAFWVGAVLAADEWVLALPRYLGRAMLSLGRAPQAAAAHSPFAALVSSIGRFFRRRDTAARAPRPATAGADGFDRDSFAAGVYGDVADADESTDPAEDEYDEPDAEQTDTDAVYAEAEQEEYEDEEAEADEDEEAEAYENDDAGAEEQEPQEADPADAPAAHAQSRRAFSQKELREKIKQLPINFAPKTKAQAQPMHQEADLSGYQFPELNLLEEPEGSFNEAYREVVEQQAVSLESALQQFKIDGEVVGIDTGPVITLFEVRLAPGTKVAKISAVSSDIARSLKAQNIRIVPNSAGKDTVGIEIPNQQKEKVRMKELMAADPEAWKKMKLPMWLGKDASGNPLIQDLNQMPHMLIAGTTGSGKSVCMNSIIMSFLYTKRPDELKLVLVDPKMVEMSMFKDIPHLMCPVVTEMAKAASILEWAVTKMDERYELLAEVGVRDIAGYNSLGWEQIKERMAPATEQEEARIPRKLPYLVFVIDELADLMMTNKEVEGFIVRIAQKARAVGMHLILATQRPQANVVTGLIKSNMPCRVAFKVASGMDSRIVLDHKGAELLLGYGDMMFVGPRSSEVIRAQGTLVDDIEIRKTVKFLKEVASPSFEPALVQMKSPGMDDDSGERDELFDDAVRVVLESQRGSVSLLQRKLTIGYSRASRLIEQMAEAGIIGAYKGSQAREVNMTVEEYEALLEQAQQDAEQNDDGEAPSSAGDDSHDHAHDEEGEEDEEGAPAVYASAKEDDGVPDEIDGEHRQ